MAIIKKFRIKSFKNINTIIEFDLITKNVLISMNNKTEKVNLSSKF